MTNYQRFLVILTSLALLSLAMAVLASNQVEPINSQEVKENVTTVPNIASSVVIYELDRQTTFTAFTLSVDETDSNPNIGASNHNLAELRKTRTVCASNKLPFHTIIYIDGIGECEILDRTSKKYSDRIDILMDTKQEARNFGLKTLNYVITR